MTKFINIGFPLTDDTKNNFLFTRNRTTKDSIRSKLLLLLITEKGQRWYNPDFGTNLRRYLFEPNDQITEFDIEEDIKTAVEKYLRNVFIETIEFNPLIDSNGNTSKEGVDMFIRFKYVEGKFTGIDEINVRFTI